ncbi:MAG: hypothetical protein AAF587_19075 [Bacteroidota bacterium]
MRYLALIFSLLLSAPSLAQTSTQQQSSSTRRVSNAPVPAADFESLKLQKEQELTDLMQQYASSHPGSKDVVKDQIQMTLFTLFDLGITKKEIQANKLKEQLSVLESDEAFAAKTDELEALKDTLIEVESSLRFRRENRERIVHRKLGQIID